MVWVTIKANTAPKPIPQIKKKLMHDPDFPIRFSGTSFGAREKATVVLNPFDNASKAIWIKTNIPNRFPYILL